MSTQDILDAIQEFEEKRQLNSMIQNEQIKSLDIILIAHPKHKKEIGLLKSEGWNIHCLFSYVVPEDVLYQVTDPVLIETFKCNLQEE